MPAGRLKAMHQLNYQLFRYFLCGRKVLIFLAITILGIERITESWWTRNQKAFPEPGIRKLCLFCSTRWTFPNMQARKDLKKLIRTLMTQGGIHLVIYCVRSERVIRTLRRNYDLIRSQVKMRVPISYHSVCDLIDKYCLPHKNIVLFGQTGAGKSSLVNLMAGKNVAATSNDILRCTMHWEEYPITLDDKSYMVFDTVGLEAPQLKRAEFIDAVENSYRLIKKLKQQGGIDLLLFCIHAGEVADTLQKNYRIFHEFLCDQNVPIIVVITHLEHEARAGTMDDWWKKNGKILHRWNIHVAGHACITAIEGNFPEFYAKSRTTIQNLVKDFTDDRRKQAWIGENNIFVSLVHKLKGRNGSLDETVDRVIHYLTQRCGMSPDDASTLADRIKKDEADGAA
ncbi:P-loop containing nucleoside triphosphate hydrolase protein [Suillus decipiens]|nr:P-loop containing nucleoside triphosphate hydrolase protein [Suillus decipiens]